VQWAEHAALHPRRHALPGWLPGAVPGRSGHHAERGTFVERINQLDFKLSRRFQVGRFQVLPVLEVFNLNNSDAIISYVTTNALSASYLAPNSIMQGRMFGAGVTTRW
jgi:hypothetical protein